MILSRLDFPVKWYQSDIVLVRDLVKKDFKSWKHDDAFLGYIGQISLAREIQDRVEGLRGIACHQCIKFMKDEKLRYALVDYFFCSADTKNSNVPKIEIGIDKYHIIVPEKLGAQYYLQMYTEVNTQNTWFVGWVSREEAQMYELKPNKNDSMPE